MDHSDTPEADQLEIEHDFAQLQPDTIIDAIEALGLNCDARIFPLNSYEKSCLSNRNRERSTCYR